MDAKEEEAKFKRMIDAVSKAAKADGKITDEEFELLESVHVNVMVYDQAVQDALEDGIIEEHEEDILTALKQQILNDAWDIASISEGVSNDELKLLEVILKEIEAGKNA
ncbi:MAG: hypothetical protein OEZ01_00275 [Candidatus Heimdallarchaeota archaeon]|nr:hypothetical protein [Candidatus Heimdallarchaeota archaeon]MDH5644407.1 hypothetical protein [Candidatus Heimdallarchaeota archaeon]